MGPGETMYVKVLGLGLSEHGCLTNSLGLFFFSPGYKGRQVLLCKNDHSSKIYINN